ncbi:hypothetical protein ACA910_010749 [Epithemia clementina (nom. ined.)]
MDGSTNESAPTDDSNSNDSLLFVLSYWSIMLLCSSAVGSFGLLSIWRIVFPTVWSYPWPPAERAAPHDRTKTVLMAGSFNPPHLGHIEMIRYLASRYGHVIVVVGHNPNKSYLVSPDQRVEFIKECIRQSDEEHLTNYHKSSIVTVKAVSGYIWQKVPEAQIFFRGIRTWEKDGAEERILQIQNTWGPIVYGPFWFPRTTYFLEGNPKYNHISSTLIREICSDSHQQSSTSLSSSITATATAREAATTEATATTIDTRNVDNLLKLLVPECIVSDVRKLYSEKRGG